MAQVAVTLPRRTQGPVYSTSSTPWSIRRFKDQRISEHGIDFVLWNFLISTSAKSITIYDKCNIVSIHMGVAYETSKCLAVWIQHFTFTKCLFLRFTCLRFTCYISCREWCRHTCDLLNMHTLWKYWTISEGKSLAQTPIRWKSHQLDQFTWLEKHDNKSDIFETVRAY